MTEHEASRGAAHQTWNHHIDLWTTSMGAADLSPDTIKQRLGHMSRLRKHLHRTYPGQDLGPWDLTIDHLERWLANKAWCASTKRSHQAAALAFWQWAADRDPTRVDITARLKRVRQPAGVPRPAGDDVIAQAMAGADERVAIMLGLGHGSGLRRGEIARVRREDLEKRGDKYWLRVLGKGRKVRYAQVPTPLAWMIERYQDHPGPLFPSQRHPGPLTAAHVGKLMSRALSGPETAHWLRHSYATRFLTVNRGAIPQLQELMGHANVQTTMGYVRVDMSPTRMADPDEHWIGRSA